MRFLITQFLLIITVLDARHVYMPVYSDPLKWRDANYVVNGALYKKLVSQAAASGIEITTERDNNRDTIIIFDVPTPELFDFAQTFRKKILYIWEPAVIIPANYDIALWRAFDIVLTWNDEILESLKKNPEQFTCLKLFYPEKNNFVENSIPFAEKKLCVLIASNKNHSDTGACISLSQPRADIIDWFEKYEPLNLDLYGRGWPAITIYKGIIPGFEPFDPSCKIHVLSQYRFCICFENSSSPGYISEKILNCLASGCIPVYLGSLNIKHYIPEDCFIHYADFASIQDLFDFLETMDEKTHQRYVDCARKWLSSEQSQHFSHEYFIGQLLSLASE